MILLNSHFINKKYNHKKFFELLFNKILTLIKKIRMYTKEKIDNIKSLYDVILSVVKKYLDFLRQNAK